MSAAWSPTSSVWGGGQPAQQQGSAELGKSLLTLLPVPGSSAAAGCFRAAAAATAAAAAAEAGAGEERVRGAGGGGGEEEGLVSWIRMVMLSQGGKVPGAQLGGILASSDPKRYRFVKKRFGGLIPLLSRYPELFVLANDPPLNHVLVVAPASSGAAGSHGSPSLGGQALRSMSPPTRPATPQRAKKALCPLSPSRALQNVEMAVAECAAVALRAAPGQALKAVELANALRAQLGTEVLASMRDYHGGLLSLLERNTTFEVTRVPKLDTVKLRAAAAAAGDDGSGGGEQAAAAAAAAVGLLRGGGGS